MKTRTCAQILSCAAAILFALPVAGQSVRPPGVPEGLNVVSREERYELVAERLGQVVELLNEMRLEGEGAAFSQGLTDYRVTPQWKFEVLGEGCGITAVSVDVDITITLPRWRAAVHSVADEQLRWREVLLRLTRHEYRHRDITIEVAAELLTVLEGLEAGTCTAVRRAAESALALARAELKRRHAAFDAIDGRTLDA
ncbi:MAG: DUF922 domain-containing protein [Longimicrobiales bacterium]